MEVAVGGSCGVWEMPCAGVANNVLGLQYAVVMVCRSHRLRCESCSVWALQCIEVLV